MKKLISSSVISMVAAGAATLALLSGCQQSQPTVDDPQALEAYLQSQATEQIDYTKYDAYFDMSDGMLSAYSDPDTKSIIQSIVNKINGNTNCEAVYGLKNGEIEKLDMSLTQLYNYIMTPSSYSMVAPLEKTLEKIVSGDVSAFLVTDFEEYKEGKIQLADYADPYFIQWIERGNSITFFIIDYKEKTLDKHLFLTVFDTQNGALLSDIEGALQGNANNYKRFNLTNNFITTATDYLAANMGGTYHDSKKEDLVTVTNESGSGDTFTQWVGYNAEYYPFQASWKDIVNNAKAMQEPGVPEPYEHLLSNLKIDFSGMSGYKIEELGINVKNIQADYGAFNTELAYKLYADSVPQEFVYPGPKEGREIKDMLELDAELDDNVADIAIDLDDKFTGEKAGLQSMDMIRVDVVIAKCDIVPMQEINELFAWPGNECMAQAVKNTLQKCNPKGKVVYTYFLKAY